MKKHKPNLWQLWLGLAMVAFLLIVAIAPGAVTDSSPYNIEQIRFDYTSGQLNVLKAPFKPSIENPMGTDDLGRDIWAYIAYGTLTTLTLAIIAAVISFMIALPFALFGGKGVHQWLSWGATLFAAFPGLLFAILILQIQYFSGLNRFYSSLVFIGVMVFVSWMKLAMLLMERIDHIEEEPFILGARALGKSKLQIIFHHLVPHLLPEVLVLFFMEIARNLSFMMQLGLFNVFIGNLRLIMDTNNGVLTYINVSYEPEWSSMLATSRTYLTVAPWTVLYPALAFFYSVLSFNLISEGLRQAMQTANSAYGTQLRWLMSRVVSKRALSLGLIGIILLSLVPQVQAWQEDKNFQFPDHQQPQNPITLDNLFTQDQGDNLERSTYPLPPRLAIDKARVSYHIQGQVEVPLSIGPSEAYQVITPGSFTGELLDCTEWDLYRLADQKSYLGSLLKEEMDIQNKVLILNATQYSNQYLIYWTAYFHSQVDPSQRPLAYMWIQGGDPLPLITPGDVPRLTLSPRLGQTLLESSHKAITITAEITTTRLPTEGVNYYHIYEPRGGQVIDNAYIAIGLPLNRQGGQEGLDTFFQTLVKSLVALENQRASFIFLLLDGTDHDMTHGIHAFAQNLPEGIDAQDIKVYIDLTHLQMDGEAGGGQVENTLQFSALQAPITRQYAWHMGQMLERGLEKLGPVSAIPAVRQGAEYQFIDKSSMNAMFWEAGIATLIISGTPKDWDDLGDLIINTIFKNNY